jgi:hypothetical protein
VWIQQKERKTSRIEAGPGGNRSERGHISAPLALLRADHMTFGTPSPRNPLAVIGIRSERVASASRNQCRYHDFGNSHN